MSELEILEKTKPISEGEEIILKTLLWADMVFTFLAAGVLELIADWLNSVFQHLHWPPMPFSVFEIEGSILVLIATLIFAVPQQLALEKRSPSTREKLRRNIEQLERKIVSFGN